MGNTSAISGNTAWTWSHTHADNITIASYSLDLHNHLDTCWDPGRWVDRASSTEAKDDAGGRKWGGVSFSPAN